MINIGDLVMIHPTLYFAPEYIQKFWNSKPAHKVFIVERLTDDFGYVYSRSIDGENTVEGIQDNFIVVRKASVKTKNIFELLGLL